MRVFVLFPLLLLACGPGGGAGGRTDDRSDDSDGDGYSTAAGDCDDTKTSINPSASDVVGDAIDQNCDGVDGTDVDADGHASTASGGDDCDDADAAVYPGAGEVWYDGVDQQCDGTVNDGDQDGDGSNAVEVGGDDCDDMDASVRPNEISGSVPADGETGVYYRSRIFVNLRYDEATAVPVLRDASGAEVSGTVTMGDREVWFEPLAPLSPSSDYTLEVPLECPGIATISFTSSEVGAPLVDPDALVGRAYTIKAETLWSPHGFGGVLRVYLQDALLLGVTDVGDTHIGLRAAAGDVEDFEQDTCLPTHDADAGFADPDLEASFASVHLYDGLEILGLSLSGSFSPDGERIEGIRLSTELDMRQWYAVFGSVDSPEEACTFIESFGVACTACASDGQPSCVDVALEDGVATRAPELGLVEVSAGECE